MRACAFCGEPIPEEARRCRSCDAEVVTEEDVEPGTESPEDGPSMSCPRCGGSMRRGFVAPGRPGGLSERALLPPSRWHAGRPRGSSCWGYPPGEESYPLQALRCGNCGYVEWYANRDEG